MSEPTVSPDEKPAGLQEAVEKAKKSLRGAAEQIGMEMGDEVAWNTDRALYVLGNSLYAVLSAAQLSALESVAKEMCGHCKRGRKVLSLRNGKTWEHPPEGSLCWCECMAGPIHAMAARLRSEAGSGSEPGAEKNS